MKNMHDYKKRVTEAADLLRSRLKNVPEICVTLGSGLSSLADTLQDKVEIPYTEITGFPETTVSGHDGVLIAGTIKETPVLMMKGRFHYYEGHSIEDVVFPVRVFSEMGLKRLILTNAAGGVNESFTPGDLMAITDHISMFCESPLRGANHDEYGPRFPDQSNIYNWKRVLEKAVESGIEIHKGVYFYAKGPMYETPAEIRMVRTMGGDAVGMSTVPEAIIASHSGIEVLGISTITNFAAGMTDKPLSHKEVMEVGLKASENLKKLVIGLITE